jgi:hypothetical protein
VKAVARINTHRERFDIRMAAGCLAQNGHITGQVLADECATPTQRREARELLRLTELSLTGAIGAYLKTL